MWRHTERLVRIWLGVTLLLAVGIVVVLVVYGPDSVQLKLALVGAVLLDVLTVRRLCREWAWQARGSW